MCEVIADCLVDIPGKVAAGVGAVVGPAPAVVVGALAVEMAAAVLVAKLQCSLPLRLLYTR